MIAIMFAAALALPPSTVPPGTPPLAQGGAPVQDPTYRTAKSFTLRGASGVDAKGLQDFTSHSRAVMGRYLDEIKAGSLKGTAMGAFDSIKGETGKAVSDRFDRVSVRLGTARLEEGGRVVPVLAVILETTFVDSNGKARKLSIYRYARKAFFNTTIVTRTQIEGHTVKDAQGREVLKLESSMLDFLLDEASGAKKKEKAYFESLDGTLPRLRFPETP